MYTSLEKGTRSMICHAGPVRSPQDQSGGRGSEWTRDYIVTSAEGIGEVGK